LLVSACLGAQEKGEVPAIAASNASRTITIFGPEDWGTTKQFGPYFVLNLKPGPLPSANQPISRTYSPEEQRAASAILGVLGTMLTSDSGSRSFDLATPSRELARLMERKKFDARAELRALLGEAAARAGLKAAYATAKRDHSGYVITRNGAVDVATSYYLDVTNFVIGYSSLPEEPDLVWPTLGARVRIIGDSDDVMLYERRFDTDYGTLPPGSARPPSASGSKVTLPAQNGHALKPEIMLSDGERAVAGMRAILSEFVRVIEPELMEIAKSAKQ
jgi:hypothetical protein